MIQDTFKIHDKYQFEIKLGYQLEKEKPVTSYDVETYIFLPKSLGIHKQSYSKQQFYKDLRTYIRFKAPAVSIEELANEKINPLKRLKEVTIKLIQPSKADVQEFETAIKMFCCIFKSAIRDRVYFIARKSQRENIVENIHTYIQSLKILTSSFREIENELMMRNCEQECITIFRLADEYISNLIDNFTFRIIESAAYKNDFFTSELQQFLLEFIREELTHRTVKQYPSVPQSTGDNEEIVYRRSMLKKFLGNVLFLNIDIQAEGMILEQIIFGIAAGLAMLFATGVAFFYQAAYGVLTMPFFIAMVVSYIFKDRIKDLLRWYFSNKLHNSLFDKRNDIYDGQKKKIGVCKEMFTFLQRDSLPSKVIEVRTLQTKNDIEANSSEESVMLYKKKIWLYSRKLDNLSGFQIEYVNDIIRINVFEYLSKMGDTKTSLYLLNDTGYIQSYGERVYHLNIVIRYSERENQSLSKLLRVILNKEGIKRIEEVYSEKTKAA